MKTPPEFSPEDRLAAGFIAKMAKADSIGLKALYGLYQRPLLGFILTIVREPHSAEEILQDVFVRAHEQASRYDPEKGTPFAWMATIARRMSIDWLRKYRRQPQFVASTAEHPSDFADKVISDDELDHHKTLEARWAVETLQKLPEEQRAAVELAFFRGFTHQEIAGILGKPLGTVKSDLRRGLLRLRKLYLGEDD